MKVTLEQLVGKDELGGDVPHDIYMVFIEHEALHKRTPSCKVHVGYIGMQTGANFAPLPPFTEILGSKNQEQVIAEVKRLHGRASPERPMDLPPAMVIDTAE